MIKIEANFFKHISAISNNLIKKLSLPRRTSIIPIGADIISSKTKTFNSLNLLYVGTLFNRNIEQTIIGFSNFYHRYKNKINLSYTIVGSSHTPLELEGLKILVREKKLTGVVNLAGQIPHDKLTSFFDNHNIGVSYIPKTDFFNAQPPTKSFEYMLSGMPVLATNTKENRLIIHPHNGVLINDNAEAFFQGLIQIYHNRKRYNSNHIRATSSNHQWVNISTILKEKLNAILDT